MATNILDVDDFFAPEFRAGALPLCESYQLPLPDSPDSHSDSGSSYAPSPSSEMEIDSNSPSLSGSADDLTDLTSQQPLSLFDSNQLQYEPPPVNTTTAAANDPFAFSASTTVNLDQLASFMNNEPVLANLPLQPQQRPQPVTAPSVFQQAPLQQTSFVPTQNLYVVPHTATAAVEPPTKTKLKMRSPRSATKPKNNKRKASEISVPEPPLEGSVLLSPETLRSMTSETFEVYFKKVLDVRTLGTEELRQFKLQRRKVKNRESAKKSRRNTKQHFAELEQKVTTLQSENSTLRNQLLAAQNENGTMKKEMEYLRNLVRKNKGLRAIYSGIQYLQNLTSPRDQQQQQQSPHATQFESPHASPHASPQSPLQMGGKRSSPQRNRKTNNFLRSGSQPQSWQTSNVSASSVCLLLVLFSFGLFWNHTQSPFAGLRQTPVRPVGANYYGARHPLNFDRHRAKSGEIIEISRTPDQARNRIRMERAVNNREAAQARQEQKAPTVARTLAARRFAQESSQEQKTIQSDSPRLVGTQPSQRQAQPQAQPSSFLASSNANSPSSSSQQKAANVRGHDGAEAFNQQQNEERGAKGVGHGHSDALFEVSARDKPAGDAGDSGFSKGARHKESGSHAMNIVEHEDEGIPSDGRMVMDASDAHIVKTEERIIPEITHWKPNCTYLMCDTVHHIIPPAELQVKDNVTAPLVVVFVIPPDALDAKGKGGDANARKVSNPGLLEVTCQVLDVSVIGAVDNVAAPRRLQNVEKDRYVADRSWLPRLP